MNEHLKDAVSGKEISPVLWKAGIRLILTTVVMLSILFLAAGPSLLATFFWQPQTSVSSVESKAALLKT